MWDEMTKTLVVGRLRIKAATESAAREAARREMAFPLDADPVPEHMTVDELRALTESLGVQTSAKTKPGLLRALEGSE